MKKIITAIMLVGALMSPAYAQSECTTKEDLKTRVAQSTPDAKIVLEGVTVILFSSPSKPSNLFAMFDENGCLASAKEMPKTAPIT